MTSQQLQAARAEKWRQTGNALLTLEDARAWIKEAGLVLNLPRRAQLQVDAPSFVEAVLGQSNPTPDRKSIEQATELWIRLTAEDTLVPLNLFGSVGEQPDFLVSSEILPYIFALRGDRDWKRAPQVNGVRSVSPLISHVYEALEKDGAATLTELRDRLGSELTEGAILRALSEMWAMLRVVPVFSGKEEPAIWQLMKQRFSKALAQGTSTSQVTAISVLTSLYLQTGIAASAEEIEVFLSPLSSRSKIREVIRGLAATRQLHTVSLGAEEYLYIAGTLPEFPEVEEESEEGFEATSEAGSEEGTPRERRAPGGFRDRKTAAPGRSFDRGFSSDRPRAPRSADGGTRPVGHWKKRVEDSEAPRTFDRSEGRPPRRDSFRDSDAPRPRKPRFEGGEEGRSERRSFDRPRSDRPAGRPAFKSAGDRPKRSFDRSEGRPPRRDSFRDNDAPRPRKPRFEGGEEGRSERRSFDRPRSDRPAARSGFKSAGDRPKRTFDRSEGRPPRRDSFRDNDAPRPRKPRFEGEEGRSERRSFDRPRTDRPRSDRPSFKSAGDRPKRSFDRGEGRPPRRDSFRDNDAPRPRKPRLEGEEGRSERRSFDRPRSDRPAGRPGFKSAGDRPKRSFDRSEGRPPRRDSFRDNDAPRPRKPRSEGEEGRSERRSFDKPRTGRPSAPRGEKRSGGFGGRSTGRPKSGGSFGRKPAGGGKFSSRPGSRPAKKSGRKDRPE